MIIIVYHYILFRLITECSYKMGCSIISIIKHGAHVIIDSVRFFIVIGESFRYETNGLRLLTPQRSDTGTYSCLATVPSQPSVSASAFIIVEGNDS